MSNPVGWFEIYVDDIERAKAFYSTVFGAELSKLQTPPDFEGLEMWMFPMDMQKYGAPGALVKMPGFPAGNNSVLVYFSCADCAVEAAKAEQAGGKVHKAKMPIGENGHIALVIDTEGNMIGLHSMA